MADDHPQQVYAAESSSTTIVCPPTYLRTVPGILRVIEIVLSIITFACSASTPYWLSERGGGWVTFVGVSAMITVAVLLLLHCINLMHRIPLNIVIELILTIIWTLFYLIAGIVAASLAGRYSGARGHAAMGAAAFFAFATCVVMAVDSFLLFRNNDVKFQFRSNREATVTTTTTTTTTSDYSKSEVGHY